MFNDARIEQLAAICRLPDSADRQRFGESLREAARIYAQDARYLTAVGIRDEIATLYKAACRRAYGTTAALLANLSPQSRAKLTARLKLPGPRSAGLRLPSAEELRDHRQRDEASDMIERVCRIGGKFIEGRKRPSGKHSVTWKPKLHAPGFGARVELGDDEMGLIEVPELLPRQAKLDAERRFVMHLQLAWLEAVGMPPTATVNPSRSDRPFANMVRECLKLVGAHHADAVGLINELHRRLKSERKRLADMRRRQRREVREAKKTF